jgi:ABC-type uncharacterized transport system permease subunit
VTSLAITSITNFVLAGEVLFLAGRMTGTKKARFSAAWYWSGMMLLLGLGALIGGIDHGFFEASNQRYVVERANWIVLGAMTFCVLMTMAKQFWPPRLQRIVLVVGVVQFAANTIVVLLIDSFLDVVLNYAPVILLLLIMNFVGLKNGTGSWTMIAGILILLGASAIQAMGVDAFMPLDHNGLYHVISMIGALLLYLGGRRLRSAA